MRSYKRIDNLEFRWIDSNYHRGRYEIVRWYEVEKDVMETCETIATWEESGGNLNLKFVGDLPFDKNINHDFFWHLAYYGNKIVNAELKL